MDWDHSLVKVQSGGLILTIPVVKLTVHFLKQRSCSLAWVSLCRGGKQVAYLEKKQTGKKLSFFCIHFTL